MTFAENVYDILTNAATAFEAVDYRGRLIIWVSVEHAEAVPLILSWYDTVSRLPGIETPTYEGQVNPQEIAADPTPTLRDAMDTLWQGFGLPHCLLFDGDRQWKTDR